MPAAPKHDYDRDGIEHGFRLLHRLGRILERVESAALAILLVVFGTLAGAVAGTSVTHEWRGTDIGAMAGAGAGVWLARRQLVRGGRFGAKMSEPGPGLDAPHVPGVQEQFARARRRVVLLTIPLCGCLATLLIVLKAGSRTTLLPGWMREWPFLAIVFAVAAASLALIAANSRCPHCRRRLADVIRARRCPHCGVALRD